MPAEPQRCIAVTGGGTAGHALAAVAISRTYRATFRAETFFIGCAAGFESRLAPARGEDLVMIPGPPYERQANIRAPRALPADAELPGGIHEPGGIHQR